MPKWDGSALSTGTIFDNGNVGIGTEAPGRKLTVSRVNQSASGQLELRTEGGIEDGNFDGLYFTQGADGATPLGSFRTVLKGSGFPDLAFYTRTFAASTETERLRILNNGNVGIGNSNPDAKLTIGTPGQTWTDFGITSDSRIGVVDGPGGRRAAIIGIQDGTASFSGFHYGTGELNITIAGFGGNVGIGTTSAFYKLTVNGQPAANGYTAFTNYSDARLKKNVTDVESSLDKLMQLRPVQYQYNDAYLKLYNDSTSADRVHKGFIAQEIQQIFPEMVGSVEVEGTEYLDLNLSNLQVYMVKAMQEMKELMDAKDERLDTQQKLIEQLQKDLNKLKKKQR